ncbi:hypothetical protein OpiT1DRAFT_01252 [Opitutaceae bacterium TAV1]|nr:hypothetical protein OpiT1DRAFT_01252 [Opitutaceae bacterium TAV1]
MSTITQPMPCPPRLSPEESNPRHLCGNTLDLTEFVLRQRSRKLEDMESLIAYEKTYADFIAESDRGSYVELINVAARALQSARHTIDTNLMEIALKAGGGK